MEQIKLSEIVSAVNGSYGYDADVWIDNISTDTRTISEGSVFLALKGARFDGHDFAAKAMELGAQAVITERAVEGARCIIVDSTAKALLDLAGYYRDKRQKEGIRESLKAAYEGSIHTVLTSGLIMVLVTGIIGFTSTDPAVGPICLTLSIGTASAILLILFIYPGMLAAFDRWVGKRKKKRET